VTFEPFVDRINRQRWLVVLASSVFALIVFRAAWLADDAYITLRTVDNFVNGYGLTWNVSERVQAYTHPLWMFLLSTFYLVTREAYYTTIAVSLSVSVATVVLICRQARTTLTGICAVLILCTSRSYVDYSTSGLENPLTHLVLAVYAYILSANRSDARSLQWLALVACLGMLNRMDAILLFLPSLIHVALLIDRKEACMSIAKGFIPAVLWEVFSVIYYGFPFPNTAYAKLKTGIGSVDQFQQGLHYLFDSLSTDPVTLLLVALGLIVAYRQKDRLSTMLIAGAILYIVYVIKIGGDYMSGRFFTGPFLLSIIALLRLNLTWRFTIPTVLTAIVVGLISSAWLARPTWIHEGEAPFGDKGIIDERGFYVENFGLMNVLDRGSSPLILKRPAFESIRQPVIRGFIGVAGYSWGPDEHIIDIYGLADPLLSRLPNHDLDWRVGHYERSVPAGYAETIATGSNLIESPPVAELYTRIKTVTQGPLFSTARWKAIWYLNTGQDAALLKDLLHIQQLVYEADRLLKSGEPVQAIELLQETDSLQHNNAEVGFTMAKALRLTGRSQSAVNYILDALILFPKKEKYVDEFYLILKDATSENADRIQLLEKAISLDPGFLAAHLNLGNHYLDQGDAEAAQLEFARSIAHYPVSHQSISEKLAEVRFPPESFGRLSTLLPFDQRDPAHWLELYEILTDIGTSDDSGKALKMGVNFCGTNLEIQKAISTEVQLLMQVGRIKQAGKLIAGVVHIRPDLAIAHYYVGVIHEQLDQKTRAISALTLAARLVPNEPLVHQALARVLAAAGFRDEGEIAGKTYESLLKQGGGPGGSSPR
jgi:arabinofuranosyltransferase